MKVVASMIGRVCAVYRPGVCVAAIALGVASCKGDATGPTPQLPPVLTSVSPATGVQGTSFTATLGGTNFDTRGTTGASFTGTGITVSNIVVTSTTSATAQVAIATDAPLGLRTLSLSANGATGAPTFTVLPGVPTLASLSAKAIGQSASLVDTLIGTNFVAGSTSVDVSGTGVIALRVDVVSPTMLVAMLSATTQASLGNRAVTVTTAGGTSAAQTLVVNPPVPAITGLSVNAAIAGTTTQVVIMGTDFVAGATTVQVSGTGVTVNGLVVGSLMDRVVSAVGDLLGAASLGSRATTLTFALTVAANATPGARTLTITTPGGTSLPVTFTVVAPAPTIRDFSASPQVLRGAGDATLSWSGITSATTCTIDHGVGDVPCADGSVTAHVTASTTYTLLAKGPGGNATWTASVAFAPAIGSFTATPSSIAAGATATLAWSGVSDATTCSIDNGVGTVLCANGSVAVTPTATTTYTLTATGAGGSQTAPITVTIIPAAGIGGFTATPATIVSGNSSTLAWTGVTGATTCAIDNGVGTVACTNASVSVSPTSNTTYTFTATGPGGARTATAPVTVTPAPAHIGSFGGSPSTIVAGNSATLAWTGIAGATTCSIDNGVGTVSCADGNVSVSPTSNTTYTLTATGPGGAATATAVITVTPAAPHVGTFTGTPATIVSGNSSTLAWTGITGATTCSIDNGVGTVACADGNASVSPTATATTTTTYTLTATGPGGTSTATTAVTVNPAAAHITTFAASPTAIIAGNSTSLAWTGITNATSCTIDNGVGTVACANGNVSVSPTSNTTYTLTANSAGGNATATAVVTVHQIPTLVSISPNAAAQGATTTVTFTGTNFVSGATTVNVSGSGVTVSGVNVTGPTSLTATFTVAGGAGVGVRNVTITTAGGTTTPAVSFTVNVPPSISAFAASSATLTVAQPTVLSWSTSNATSCSIDNGVGSVACNDSIVVTPGSSKTYTLSATGNGTTVTSSTSVSVGAAGQFLYAANNIGNTLNMLAIDPSAGTLTTIAGGTIATQARPYGVAVHPTGKWAYAVNNSSGANSVSEYVVGSNGALTANGTVSIPPAGATPANPRTMVIDPTGRYAYVINQNIGTISMFTIDGTGHLIANGGSVAAGSQPVDIVVEPLGRYAYAVDASGNQVLAYKINANGTLTANGNAAAGPVPLGIAVDPTGKYVYVTARNGNTISMFSIGATGALTSLGAVASGSSPEQIVVDPTARYVYVANNASNTVGMYSISGTGTLTSLGSIAAGSAPSHMTFDQSGKFIYVANRSSASISMYRIDAGGTLTSLGTLALSGQIEGLAVSR